MANPRRPFKVPDRDFENATLLTWESRSVVVSDMVRMCQDDHLSFIGVCTVTVLPACTAGNVLPFLVLSSSSPRRWPDFERPCPGPTRVPFTRNDRGPRSGCAPLRC